MIRRRPLLTASACLVATTPLRAQPGGRPRRVGYVAGGTEAVARETVAAFRDELRLLGWVDGRDVVVDVRHAMGDSARAAALGEELLHAGGDVLVVTSTPAALAAKSAGVQTPVVFAMVSDPAASGIVASLARPGGRLTGWSNLLPQTSLKLLELLREAAPRISRVAVLFDPSNPGKLLEVEALRTSAQGGGLALHPLPVRGAADVPTAFAAMAQERVDGLVVLVDVVTLTNRRQIVASAAAARLPTIYQASEFVVDGGLMSYGMNMVGQFRRTAHYVDRILRGANPADLPVEQPTVFELVVNRKAARALGLQLPQSVLLRADRTLD